MDWSDESADEIRNALRQTRARATTEIGEVVAGAREFADWRSYPRRYPLATLAAAAVAGYAIIPKREKLLEANTQALEDFVRKHSHQLGLDSRGAKKTAERGLLGALVVTVGTAALKMGLSAVGQDLVRRLKVHQGTVTGETVP